MPIAKRKKKDLSYLRLAIRLGATDKELMKDIGISRTTLWRWKKEMNERLKSGNGRGVL
jgi:DNA-binding Xre family transcriptional regulator